MKSKIECRCREEFLDVIEGLVKRGLVFSADATTWTITLTGGY